MQALYESWHRKLDNFNGRYLGSPTQYDMRPINGAMRALQNLTFRKIITKLQYITSVLIKI